MFTTRNLVVMGAVCAFSLLPLAPRSIPFVGSISLVREVHAQTSTNWNDGAANPNWNDDLNWNNNEPTCLIDATHLDDPSDILVNTTLAKAKSFDGDGDDMNDRFVVIDASKKLHVCGDMTKSGTKNDNFVFRFENGTAATSTILDVDGSVTAYDLMPTSGFGLRGEYLTVAVAVDVVDSNVTAGNHADIDVGGDVKDVSGTGLSWTVKDDSDILINGNVTGYDMTIGTTSAGATDVTTMKVGSIGDPDPIHETWTLQGYASLTVSDDVGFGSGKFVARDATTAIVIMKNHRSMTAKRLVKWGIV